MINGLAFVPTGNTLIIEPGVEIRFKKGTDYSYNGDDSVDVGLLYIEGNLIAEGSSDQRIIFTRQGDFGNWDCVVFEPGADVSSSLKYCRVEYANQILSLESRSYFGAIGLKNPKISISHSEISNNADIGIHIDNSTPSVRN